MYTDSNDRNTHSHDMKHSSHAAGISYKIMSKHIDIFLISNAIWIHLIILLVFVKFKTFIILEAEMTYYM